MSLGFKKFFNSEEGNAHKIDWDTAHVLEKLDGSCIQVYYDDHDMTWYAGTTGTANGEGEVNNKLGTTFNDLFWNTLETKYDISKESWGKTPMKRYCYVFELTTPYNIVVKPHGESSATLLTVRDLETLEEKSYEELLMVGKTTGIPVVKSYDLNAKDVGVLLLTFENMVWSEEGYVVVDEKLNRIKVKNPAYVAVHHLKGKTAEHNILTIVKTNEIEEFGATFPDRLDELNRLKVKYDELVSKLETIWESLKDKRPKNITPKEKKKYAEAVFSVLNEVHTPGFDNLKIFSGLFFGLNDGKINSVKEFILNYDDKALYKIL